MIYIILAAIIVIGMIVISIIPENNKDKLNSDKIINLSLGLSGLLIIALSYFICTVMIGNSSTEPEWIDWARNMFGIYYNISLPFLGVCLFVISLCIFTTVRNKKRKTKILENITKITSVVSSAALLLLAFFYSLFVENNILPLDIFILISGISEAFVMRLTFALDYSINK